MSLPRTVAEALGEHVSLEVEGIDRMYLNVYQPRLQTDRGVAAFFRCHRGEIFASSALMDPISKSFIAAVDRFVLQEQIPLITFAKGQRKDDVAKEYHARSDGSEVKCAPEFRPVHNGGETPEEAHCDENTAAIHSGVQGQGCLGGPDSGAVPG